MNGISNDTTIAGIHSICFFSHCSTDAVLHMRNLQEWYLAATRTIKSIQNMLLYNGIEDVDSQAQNCCISGVSGWRYDSFALSHRYDRKLTN